MRRFGQQSKFRAKPLYHCKKCSMEWAAIPPEKTINSKGKLAVTAEAREKVRTCPGCGDKDPIFFASKREAHRYRELKLAELAGLISDIELQPRFKFPELGIEYRADFAYTDDSGKRVYEDAKGKETREFLMKMKLMKKYFPAVTVNLV